MHRNEVTAIEGFKAAKATRHKDAERARIAARQAAEAEAAKRRARWTLATLATLVAVDVVLWAPIIAELLA